MGPLDTAKTLLAITACAIATFVVLFSLDAILQIGVPAFLLAVFSGIAGAVVYGLAKQYLLPQ